MRGLMVFIASWVAWHGCVAWGDDTEQAASSTPAALSQYMAPGMAVAGVRAPYYDKAGNLQAQLYGGKAKIIKGGMAEIQDLRIDFYRDGAVFMTVYAPICLSHLIVGGEEVQNVLQVQSDGDVLVVMDSMEVVGRGFTYSSDSHRFEILNDARVLVKELEGEMRELEF